jgi:hypothetical protein
MGGAQNQTSISRRMPGGLTVKAQTEIRPVHSVSAGFIFSDYRSNYFDNYCSFLEKKDASQLMLKQLYRGMRRGF